MLRRAGGAGGGSVLARVTALMYLLEGAGLLASTAVYTPGKNPRWVLGTLGAVGLAFAVTALLRGRRFTRAEATIMLVVQLTAIVRMTQTSALDEMAFSNGVGMSLIGIYTSLLLRRWAVVIFYVGMWSWVGVVAGRDDRTLALIAGIIALEATLATEVIRVMYRRMRRLAATDPLTRALNRHGLEEVGRRLLARSARRRTPLSAAVIDLDDLRSVNNTQGHRAGDDLLVAAAEQWLTRLPSAGAAGRIGGDEFVVLLPGDDEDAARERLAALAAESTVRWTAGVAQARPGDTLSELIARADRAMYARKPTRGGA